MQYLCFSSNIHRSSFEYSSFNSSIWKFASEYPIIFCLFLSIFFCLDKRFLNQKKQIKCLTLITTAKVLDFFDTSLIKYNFHSCHIHSDFMLQSHAKVCTPIVRHDANFYIKTKYYVLVENRNNQKKPTLSYRVLFCSPYWRKLQFWCDDCLFNSLKIKSIDFLDIIY